MTAALGPIIAALAPLALGALGGMGGSKGGFKSTYGKPQIGLINDLVQQVKGMQGGGGGDITQNQNYQTGQDFLQRMFNDPEFFQAFEAPLQRQFQEQTTPELANRFAGMGSGGALGSTAFRNQLAREGSNLSTNIAALRGQMQQSAVPQLLGYAQQPFQNMMQLLQQALTPTNNVYQPPSAGFLGGIAPGLSGLSQGAGQYAGQYLAGLGGGSGNTLPTNVSFPSAASSAQLPFAYGG